MTANLRSLLDFRLIVVTGKGGTGKTAVSCALAEAARREGQRVLLVETAAAGSISSIFEQVPRKLGYAGRSFRPGLHALRIDPHEALADYARIQIGLGAVTDRILKAETFQQLLEAAPGWRELIILGKIWHLEQKKQVSGEPFYDLIIVDAPATGHGLTFLDVPRVVQSAVRAGPLARHASWVEALVHDRKRTLMLPVTLPEELPVQETLELVDRANRDIDIGVDRVVVNRMPTRDAEVALHSLNGMPNHLEFEWLPPIQQMRLMLEGSIHENRRAFKERERISEGCALPIIDLPLLPLGFGPKTGWEKETAAILLPPVWPRSPTPTATHSSAPESSEVSGA